MMEAQKIIKYVAMAFAISLMISIIGGLFNVLMIFTGSNKLGDNKDFNINNKINSIIIDVKSTNVTIKTGEKFEYFSNNKDLKVIKDNNKITFKQAKYKIGDKLANLTIYIPNEKVFEYLSITGGAGTIKLNDITTDNLALDLGAGKLSMNNLYVDSKTTINGGAGNIDINGNFKNLDLDLGVGKTVFNGDILGKSEINTGVGALTLNLNNSLDNYKIDLNKGLGSSTINGIKMKDSSIYGDGINTISIDGGVGSISINTK